MSQYEPAPDTDALRHHFIQPLHFRDDATKAKKEMCLSAFAESTSSTAEIIILEIKSSSLQANAFPTHSPPSFLLITLI